MTQDEIEQQKLLMRRNAFNICYINEAKAVLSNAEVVSRGGKIECPALLFCSNGKETSKNWVKNQREFAAMMNARLVCFDCGHYIHYYKSNDMSREMAGFVKTDDEQA